MTLQQDQTQIVVIGHPCLLLQVSDHQGTAMCVLQQLPLEYGARALSSAMGMACLLKDMAPAASSSAHMHCSAYMHCSVCAQPLWPTGQEHTYTHPYHGGISLRAGNHFCLLVPGQVLMAITSCLFLAVYIWHSALTFVTTGMHIQSCCCPCNPCIAVCFQLQ